MVGVTVKVEGDDELIEKIYDMEDAFDKSVLLDLVGERFKFWIDMNFRNQGTEKPWTPLSENTIAARRGGNSPGAGLAKILMDTGRLRGSFVKETRGDAVSVGTASEIAVFHEYGTDPYTITPKQSKFLRFKTAGGWRSAKQVNHPGLPARPMLPSERIAREIAIETLQGEIDAAAARMNQGGGVA